MHPQLATVIQEFEAASERLAVLAAQVPEDRWSVRADQRRWSAGECVAHLVLTAEAFLPRMEAALAEARTLRDAGAAAPRRYRRDLAGWLLWRMVGPPVRMKVRTSAPFVPQAALSRERAVAEFARLQARQIGCARASDGLPIQRVRIQSPFDARFRYNLYACLTILPRHQHRHLWQAEQVWPRPVTGSRTGTGTPP